MVKETIGMLGQWLACFLLIVGLIIEVVYGANIGFVLITIGGLVLALATKVKYWQSR